VFEVVGFDRTAADWSTAAAVAVVEAEVVVVFGVEAEAVAAGSVVVETAVAAKRSYPVGST
jgi:hypothetical protein